MKNYLRMIWIVMLFMGCATPAEKKVETPVAEPSFQPLRIYAAPFDKAWEATLRVLREDKVPIQTVNPEEGLIRTDYQPAPKGMRYKFSIKLSKAPEDKTAIQVRCTYEGKDDRGEYKDFTYSSPRQVMAMEDGVYRRIESAILMPEVKKEAPEAPAARAASPPPPSPAPPPPPPQVVPPPAQPPMAPPPAPAETAKPPVTPPKRVYIMLVTQKTGLLMAEPSSDSAVLMVLKKGLEVEKLSESGSWVNIEVESGKTGWVAKSLFDMPGAPAASKDLEKPAPKKEDISPSPSPPKEPPAPTRIASAPPKEAVEKASKTLATKANVNMREAPSAQSKILTILAKGKQVEKLGESAQFTRVRIPGGKTGWVASQYLQEVSPPGPKPKPEAAKAKEVKADKVALITKDKAPLKERPAEESKTITVLKKGREVERIGKSGAWTQVKLPWGTIGWVADRLLEKAR